jgi:anti-sigma B factor antagonist
MAYVSYQLDRASGLPVIALPDEIDITSANDLRAVLSMVAQCGHATIVVDMTLTQFCDSAALGVIVMAHKRALAEGGELRLVIPSAAVLRVFAVTGLDRHIPAFTSLDEALAEPPAGTTEAQHTSVTAGMRIPAGAAPVSAPDQDNTA